jgi:hypothetical protein
MSRTRRELLQQGGGVAAASVLGGPWADAAPAAPPAPQGFDPGVLEHVLSTATHDRVLVKASFARPLERAPRPRVGDTTVTGRRSDTAGRFWRWDVGDLRPDRAHRVRVLGESGRALQRATPVGDVPYWSQSSADGRYCFVSVAGEDRVAVLSFRTGREVARIRVGDHPQRMRTGVIRARYVRGR